MKKTAVLSTNAHPGYMFFVPIVEWVWNRFGWEIALFVTSDVKENYLRNPESKTYIIPEIEKPENIDQQRWNGTLAQTVRHFTANVLPESYIMVQDIDLIPLANWWTPDLTKGSISGYPDMTGGSFIPVHYTGMPQKMWFDVMGCTGDLKADMERELKSNGRAYKEKWEDYWDTDWDILTKKVKARANEFTFCERRLVNGLPEGRVDRSTIEVKDGVYYWGRSSQIESKKDMHCEWNNSSHPAKWRIIKEEMEKAFGPLPEWMDEHQKTHYAKYGI